jgi:hypothetical protein
MLSVSFDYGNDHKEGRPIVRAKPVAYCFSEQCTKTPSGTRPVRMPSVKRGEVFCHKCGHALCWLSESPGVAVDQKFAPRVRMGVNGAKGRK